MGLEIVEVILHVEEDFAITIRDEEAEHITTCGAMCDLVVENCARGESPDENATWKKLRAVLADEISESPEHITRETRFIEDLGL